MIGFIARRTGWALFATLCVIVVVFALMFVAGDPAATTLGPHASREAIHDFQVREGLDQPILAQLASYLGVGRCVRKNAKGYTRPDGSRGFCGLLEGDFGVSYSAREPVANVIARRVPRTLVLSGMAMLFELLIGVTAGIIAEFRRHTWTDTGIMFGTFVGISLPTYVTGPLALMFFAFLLGWFPVGGYGVGAWEHIRHSLLPALILAVTGAATYARVMRSDLIDTLRDDHVRTARAKGLGPMAVLFRHGVRNALLPTVTLIGLSLPFLVGGAIITEKIFAWPGLGLLTLEAINNLDAPMVMAVVVMFAIMVQIGNLLADVAVAMLDPRVRG